MCDFCRTRDAMFARAAMREVAKRANRAAMLGCVIEAIELVADPVTGEPVGVIAYRAPDAARRPLRFELPDGYPEFDDAHTGR